MLDDPTPAQEGAVQFAALTPQPHDKNLGLRKKIA
jgi:hypothetical protein